jgi:hypothetical protein
MLRKLSKIILFCYSTSTDFSYRQKFINFVEDKDLDAANSEMLDYMRRVKEEHTTFQTLQKQFVSEHPECAKFFVAGGDGTSVFYSDFIGNLDNEKSIQDEIERLVFYKDLLEKRLLIKSTAATKFKTDVVELYQVLEVLFAYYDQYYG